MNANIRERIEDYEVALVALVRNATIAECQRWLRDSAAVCEQTDKECGGTTGLSDAARCYRSAAKLLEALRR